MKRNSRLIVLAAFGLSGAAALIYEVVWTRSLSLVLGSTVYALSTMLATFMTGLALGAYIGGGIADRKKDLFFYLGLFEMGIAFCGIVSVPLIYWLPRVYYWIYSTFHLNMGLYFTVQYVTCMAVMLAPTTLMGATFPVVSRLITPDLGELGRKVGGAYSINTMGAIAGSLSAGFILIPLAGMKNAALTAASLNFCAGLAVLAVSRLKKVKDTAIVAILAFAAAAFLMQLVDRVPSVGTFYYAGRFERYEKLQGVDARFKPVFEKDYVQGTIRAFNDGGFLTIQNGGKMEGTAPADIANTFMLSVLPAAQYGHRPENMLVIGLGAGITTWFSRQLAENTEVVEINPGVAEVVSRFGVPGLLDGLDIHFDDARRYLLMTGRKYDVITSEPSVPAEATSANLYSREFYELAASRLSEGGIFCQWMPSWALTKRDAHIAAKTFASVFDYSYLWVVPLTNDFIMTGSKSPATRSPEEIIRSISDVHIAMPYSSETASREQLRDMPSRVSLVRGPERMRELATRTDLPVITDDRPFIEFAVTQNLLLGPGYRDYRE